MNFGRGHAGTVSLILLLLISLVHPLTAHAFQRMGVVGGQSRTLEPGQSSSVGAYCMDEHAWPPDTSDRFTQILHGAPAAARVTNVSTGKSIPLQQALAAGQVEIAGEMAPGTYGYVTSENFDQVVIRNRTSEPLRIDFDSEVVLGGSDHSPFPFDAEKELGGGQGSTWHAVQARQAAADAEAERLAEIEAERQKILHVQESLLAAGSSVPLDGVFGGYTRDALRDLQERAGLNVTGTLDTKTEALIEQQNQHAQIWLRALADFYPDERPSPERSADSTPSMLGELKVSAGLAPTDPFTPSARRDLVAPLLPQFNEARSVLETLGYDVPLESDPVTWMPVVKRFQQDMNLDQPREGILDAASWSQIRELAAALKNVEHLPDDASPPDNPSLRALEIPGDSISRQFFRVDHRLGHAIVRIINEAIGPNAVRQQRIRDDRSTVLLVISDTREFVHSAIRDILDIDRLGRRIAMEGGVAVRQTALGDQTLIVSSGKTTTIDLAPEKVANALAKIRQMLGLSSPEEKQRQQLASLVKERVGDADVAIVVGHELDDVDLESVVRVPLIRSAHADRSVAEIKARFQAASARPLNIKKTVVISGLPVNAREYQALAANELEGTAAAWVNASKEVHNYFRSLRIPVRAEAHRSLKNAADIIVIFAHSKDGRTVLIPNGNEVHEITAAELARFSNQFQQRKPTILLMSCLTGELGESSPSMANELIRLGAGAVIAPKTPLDVRDARDFMEAVFAQDPSKSLVERVSIVLRDPRFRKGRIRFIVHRGMQIQALDGGGRS